MHTNGEYLHWNSICSRIRDPIVFDFFFVAQRRFIERSVQRTSKIITFERYKLAQIYSNQALFFLLSELTKLTKTWRKTLIQRLRLLWSRQQMLQHCQSSSRSRRRKMRKNRRTAKLLRLRKMWRSQQNHDFASCFRFFSFSSHSQQYWACSSSTWTHRVSKIFRLCVNYARAITGCLLLRRWLRIIKVVVEISQQFKWNEECWERQHVVRLMVEVENRFINVNFLLEILSAHPWCPSWIFFCLHTARARSNNEAERFPSENCWMTIVGCKLCIQHPRTAFTCTTYHPTPPQFDYLVWPFVKTTIFHSSCSFIAMTSCIQCLFTCS